ncbi:Tetratricopeptide repeat (TPR)-like superfamily protein [Euphorbia peplus]|nr:Tetratricopeptide repeat (TPR)-like superfamily protein [Euphorbia peplus]
MEKLKSIIPDSLKGIVENGNVDNLQSTSSSLLNFLMNLSQFNQMIKDLTDPEAALCGKNKNAAMELKQKANKCYSSGDYDTALACYSQALRVAPIDDIEMDKNLVAILYLNRASLLHKIGLLTESLRDCNRALQIFPSYAKAWYRRGKVNAALGDYENAVHDLNVAKNVELSFGGKKQIESELKIIVDQHKNMGSSTSAQHRGSGNISSDFNEQLQTKLSRITTEDKGRGMVSSCDIPQASFVHKETPYALIILKSHREAYCHYCLNELPIDTVPCISCSIPLYCSEHCQLQASGETISYYKMEEGIDESLPKNVKEHIADVTSSTVSELNFECFFEHKHECHGLHWPAVLPSDMVLAGRMIAKTIFQKRASMGSNLLETLDLSYNYSQIDPESKMELHIYAIVLLHCLWNSFDFEFPINGVSLSQTIVLLSQIRVNAMAVVRMKSIDARHSTNEFQNFSQTGGAPTSSVEQVPVGQAIYTAGSLFNHSCQPNIHAYFLSRTLFIRTTDFVTTGYPLELSYGPQVGQSDSKDRLKFLEDKYSFRCQCSGCSVVNLSDLVINSFHCANLNCDGVILDSCQINFETHKLKNVSRIPQMLNFEPHSKVDELSNVAKLVLELSNGTRPIQAGYCLKCNSYCNLEALHKAMRKAWVFIKRLQDAVVVKEMSTTVLSDALSALDALRSILHRYNKNIAETHDNLAQAFCLVGDFQSAVEHCKASIKILGMLYGQDHIVIGYELVKISSLQLSQDDPSSVDTINQLLNIFERYYGSHAFVVFPHLRTLKQKLALGNG